ncbi:hypothetical protein KVT40_000059 [Elsinoe batatas]|uniref:Uncharacterized protein n=1 Tax=Elsinoe batatas TaxID=2601811 RepID=A0A8K0L723_9PEZI|nr:hypothetical protein KVT40_000059 [Elsinoe batatas]
MDQQSSLHNLLQLVEQEMVLGDVGAERLLKQLTEAPALGHILSPMMEEHQIWMPQNFRILDPENPGKLRLPCPEADYDPDYESPEPEELQDGIISQGLKARQREAQAARGEEEEGELGSDAESYIEDDAAMTNTQCSRLSHAD